MTDTPDYKADPAANLAFKAPNGAAKANDGG
jgi:hypothetical protein